MTFFNKKILKAEKSIFSSLVTGNHSRLLSKELPYFAVNVSVV